MPPPITTANHRHRRRRRAPTRRVALLALLATAGCGSGDDRPRSPQLAFPLDGSLSGAMDAVLAFPGLRFDAPVYATHAPDGSDRIFVVEQAGRIRVFDARAAAAARLFLDISDRVWMVGEQGLLGLAFDPDYATSGHFWVHYIADGPRRSVLARYARDPGDPDRADPASESVVLEVEQPYSNHNAGMIEFGPDGMLYMSLGDGGAGHDPHGHGQDRTTLLGSMLRIDPRRGSPYSIPADNPFVGAGNGVREEIWAHGMRNPWRFSFDRDTGALWLGDVGQASREEVGIVPRGGNLGWNVYEGDRSLNNPTNRPPDEFARPLLSYPRSAGASVTGGYVYRGSALPELRGAYVYGDYISGRIWALVAEHDAPLSNAEIASVPSAASFGEDRHGELLIVGHGGDLYRLARRAGGERPFPTRLSQTGLFADVASLTPVRGLLEYEVNAPLWSDGARKRRWLAVPPGPVEFAPTGAWEFPVGTVIVKHFELDTVLGARRLETRVLVHERRGWAGYTYRWNAEQSDAELLLGRADETLTVRDPSAPGGQREQTWTFPSRTDCRACHTAAAGRVLGVHTAQINRRPRGTATNQLDDWIGRGLFRGPVWSAATHPALADPGDESRSVAARARAYLAANCSACHRPGGPAPTAIDLRAGVDRDAMRALGVRPTSGDLGLPDARVVAPGRKESSVLWERMRRRDATRMPPLGSHEIDAAALELIGRWIDDM